ncbi:MAG: vitamin K epoxide reductase family protein [Bacteroidota bacterium]
MIDLVKKYLEINKFSHLHSEFDEAFLSHPNYPSLYAITDSLSLLSIENIAVKVPKEQFFELPSNFLTIYKNNIALVSKNATSITVSMEGVKTQTLTFNEFLNDWNQIVVAIEPNATLNNNTKKTFSKWYLFILPCIVLTSLSLVFNSHSLNTILLLTTSVIGLIFSVFVLQEKLGVKNEIASKLCSLNVNTSCDSVIKSDRSDINKWFGFSDLSLLFFSISVMSILIQPNESVLWIGVLSGFAIPVIVYSIWLQKVELKKWCVLCLIISSIILLQSLIFGLMISFIKMVYVSSFGFLFSVVLIASLWFLVKPVLNGKIKFEKETNELKRFKRDYRLFEFLSKDIPFIDGLDGLKGIQIGDSDVENQVTIIISPSCGHCHKAFNDAYELIKKFPERISLNVLFNINPENKDNPYKVVVESMLAIHNINPEKAEEAIVDWHINKMEFEQWKQKWAVAYVDMLVNHQVYEQYHWCLKNEFNFTPVKIINDKMFPKEYEINELKYFINDFSNEKGEKLVLAHI